MARAASTRGNRDMSETDTTDIASQELEEKSDTLPDLDGIGEVEIRQFIETALDRLSIDSLVHIGFAVRAKRLAKQEESRLTARQKIEEQLQNSGLSLRDLFPELLPSTSRKRADGDALPPKFRGPNGETWSGRGRLPNWLSILEKGGHNRQEFKIQEEENEPPPG
jgi:DNA-binding protein H-NS